MIPLGILASARVASGAPDPLAGISLDFRFEGDSITGVSDGATVASWPDTSGNSRHATQSSESLKPTRSTSAFGGVGGVVFPGGATDVALRTAAITEVAQPNVVYVVGAFPSGYAFDGIAATARHFARGPGGTIIEMGAASARWVAAPTGTASVWVFRFAGNVGWWHRNGGTRGGVSNAIGTQSLGGLTVGNGYSGGAGAGATIGAVLGGHDHTIANMNTVGAYLASKFGYTWKDITT